jgi:predicted AlkP superfamily phosphohydrolase/phosphomutase
LKDAAVLLIIGLDGATWDVAEPLIAAGRMPNLAALRRRGVWGPLASTVPPATFPSWSTFATGVNPGRHGIFDFTRRVFGTYDVAFINSTYRAAPSLWRRLSDAGKRVGVLGIPGTYPPERLNGCMISGFDTPVTTRADATFIDPPELAAVVMEEGGFPFADFQEFRIDADWYRMARARLLRGIEVKTRLARRLLRGSHWDCFMLLFGESDTVAHHFWKFHDPTSPRFSPDAEMADAVNTVYERLDAAVGELIEAAEPEATLVVSDHGFGGAGRKCLYLNQWLAAQGLQRRSPTASGNWSSRLKRLALRMVPAELQANVFRLNGGRWASRLESRSRFAGIDWERTTAFSEELNYFPSLWLNLEGREPAGTVTARDYRPVAADLCAAARELRDPETGAAVVRNAWCRDEIYDGPWVKYAPDIVLDLHLDEGHSYNCMPSATAAGAGAFHIMDRSQVESGKLAGMSGSHRPEGLFALAAEAIDAKGYFAGVNIADMTPTLMRVAGLDVPDGFDGQVIGRGAGAGTSSSPVSTAGPAEPQPYSAAEQREIAARLEALGYLG